jgi:hypothetical protein
MTRLAIALFAALFALGAPAAARAAKPKAERAAPNASASELDKLKGEYKWGMSPEDVITKVQDKVRASYDEKLKKVVNDPTRYDRLRKEMQGEIDKVKTKVIKFDGQKSGYDVSIIDQEFVHNAEESMLAAKEDTATRYFFFKNNGLYKMFLAFDKEILQGKSFRDFGKLMQARFGKAREVMVEERTKAGVRVKLDHFVWSSKGGDMLRLVDRSEFYDVYCLVIYDGKIEREQEAIRAARRTGPKEDNLVEAVTAKTSNDRDPHDNVVDQITGKKVGKPGESVADPIVVPSPNAPTTPPAVKAPTPAEVNRDEGKPAKGAKPAKGEKKTGKGTLDGVNL